MQSKNQPIAQVELRDVVCAEITWVLKQCWREVWHMKSLNFYSNYSWVPSEANIADAPSRGEVGKLLVSGAVRVPPRCRRQSLLLGVLLVLRRGAVTKEVRQRNKFNLMSMMLILSSPFLLRV
eukprot:748045-Amphidinium_carterae.1